MPVQFKVVQRVVGILLALFSITMLTPVFVGVLYRDGAILPFLGGFTVSLFTGLLMFLPVRNVRAQLKLRDGFVVVVAFDVGRLAGRHRVRQLRHPPPARAE